MKKELHQMGFRDVGLAKVATDSWTHRHMAFLCPLPIHWVTDLETLISYVIPQTSQPDTKN